MGKKYEVAIEFGGPQPVRFSLDEDEMRTESDVRILRHLTGDDPRPLRAAWEMAKRMLTEEPGAPVSIFQGGGVWVVPVESIRWIRVHDPDAREGDRSIGFVLRRDEETRST